MDERYSDALRFLREARSLPDLPHLEARFAGLVSRFGFERTTYVLMAQPGRPINPKVLFGVGDPKLRNVYLGAERFRIDPTFQAVFHKTRAFTWSDVEPLAVSEPARLLFDNARKDGSEGLIVPVHGAHGEVSALVMVGRNVELNDQAKAVLQACGALFAVAGLQLLQLSDDRESDTDRTRRETQVLVWLSRGKTLPEAAIILDISLGTAKTRLERAKAKLGGLATVPAVLEAARRGWLIDPDEFE